MERYFIYVTESTFDGLHGIYTQDVFEASWHEVDEICEELGWELIDSYSCLRQEESEPIWRIFPIHPDITLSTAELDAICATLDWTTFVKEYCVLDKT